MLRPVVAATLALAMLTWPAYAQPPARPGSWLDGPIVNWNAPGMAVPKAPASEFSGPADLCAPDGSAPPPSTAEERALDAAGWKRVATEAQWWGVVLVYAQQGVDGMCRPMQFQLFVFVDGRLAGTLSPEPMNSRTDGTGYVEALRRNAIEVTYSRYAPTDPLCCPSGEVSVIFAVERSDAGPVLVPQRS